MGEKERSDVLLVGAADNSLLRFVQELNDSPVSEFRVTICPEDQDPVLFMSARSMRIALVLSHHLQGQGTSLLQHLRNTFFQEPVHIIATVRSADLAEKVLEYGADDYIVYPLESEELAARLYSAVVRLRSLVRIYGEREFFKNAAKQEEELTSKILDQHLMLKEAFQSIESINQELEETNRQLERIARYDILSGLMNRGSLFSAMDTEIDRAVRTGAPLTGIMMDIDNFKSINDRFGHLHGDRVIAEIGQRMKAMLRRYDLAGRYGGEEFFIILPNSTLQQAYLIAERFRQQMEDNPIEFSGDSVTITASFGIAQYRKENTRETWIERCDSYLYNAKRTGRNKVVGE